MGYVGRVWVDGVEVAGAFDEILFFLRKCREKITQCIFETLRVVAVCPRASEPTDLSNVSSSMPLIIIKPLSTYAEIKIPLPRNLILGLRTIGLIIIPRILETNPALASKLPMIPLRNLSMRQKRIMSTQPPRPLPPPNAIESRIISFSRIDRELPITILRFVNRKPLLHHPIITTNNKLRILKEIFHNPLIRPRSVFVEQGEWRIPVEESDTGFYTGVVHGGDYGIVVCYACGVDGTATEGEDAGPRDTGAEAWDT